MILGLLALTVHRVLMARRGRREILARLALTGRRVLMVLKAMLGRRGRMGRPRMTWRLPMGLLAIRRRGWHRWLGLLARRAQLDRKDQREQLDRKDQREQLVQLDQRAQLDLLAAV